MIYVDQLVYYPESSLKYKRWCHMATDSDIEELHKFALEIGLRRSWFQDTKGHPHYDIIPTKRVLALKKGAKSVTTKELIEKCFPEWATKFKQAFGDLVQDAVERRLEPLFSQGQEVYNMPKQRDAKQRDTWRYYYHIVEAYTDLPSGHLLYEANADIPCAVCGELILANSLFARKIIGENKTPQPCCRVCVSFTVYKDLQRVGKVPRSLEYLYITDDAE